MNEKLEAFLTKYPFINPHKSLLMSAAHQVEHIQTRKELIKRDMPIIRDMVEIEFSLRVDYLVGKRIPEASMKNETKYLKAKCKGLIDMIERATKGEDILDTLRIELLFEDGYMNDFEKRFKGG